MALNKTRFGYYTSYTAGGGGRDLRALYTQAKYPNVDPKVINKNSKPKKRKQAK